MLFAKIYKNYKVFKVLKYWGYNIYNKKGGIKVNKKIIKGITMLVMILTICSIAFNVFALTPGEVTGDSATAKVTGIKTIGNNIVKILQTVGVVLSVIILIVLGIKYMMGSAEEKAEYKKTMIPYLVGAILIFASTTIVNVVYNIANGVNQAK